MDLCTPDAGDLSRDMFVGTVKHDYNKHVYNEFSLITKLYSFPNERKITKLLLNITKFG